MIHKFCFLCGFCAQLSYDVLYVAHGDKLVLRGLKFYVYHGVKPEETKLGQKFIIDMDVWMDMKTACLSDNLSDTISYGAIYGIVKEILEGQPQKFRESVAQLIASKTLKEYPKLLVVRVHVKKPHVDVQGSIDYLGIEITRFQTTISNM